MKGRTLIVEFHPWKPFGLHRTPESRRVICWLVSVEWCRGTWGERVQRLTDELVRLRATIAERMGPKP